MEEPLRILVADDDPDLRDMVAFYLKKQGHAITTANDGQEAVDTALQTPFDLILLDVMMPKINGYHVAQDLSEKLGDKCPKMIIMTSRDTEKEVRLALTSGASAVIQKPLRLIELKSRIAQVLKP